MEFIDNPDLRQWVKKSLRRALFQKAHELAVQTGCEVLLKVQDISNSASDTQYYATHTLKRSYDNNRLCKRSGETLIAGETGLPVAIKVDRGSQIAENGTDGFDNSPLSKEDDNDDHDYLPDPFAQDSSMTTDVQSTSEHMNSENQQTMGVSDEMNTGHQQMDEDDDMLPLADESKIDLTQDSDSDDSIVEVAEVKQESIRSPAFKQESAFGRGEASMYTHPNPYQCGVCQKVFANVQMLEHHNKTDHARTASNGGVSGTNVHQQQQEAMLSFKLEPNSYTCIRCQSTFNNSTRLHNHMTQCHMAAQTSTGNLGVVQPSQSSVQQFTNVRSPQSSPGGIPAAAGSPHSLPQITSVTSLKLMPDGMNMNVSAASTRPVPTSLFQSPVRSQHPSMSSPGSSPHGGSHHGGSPQGASPRAQKRQLGHNGRLSQDATASKNNIMAAILSTAGPVTTHAMLTSNWRFLRLLTTKQFQSSANQLQTMGLGVLVAIQNQTRASHVFVKKPPQDVQHLLEVHPDLNTNPSFYAQRYSQPASKKIKLNIRSKLVAMGMLLESQLL